MRNCWYSISRTLGLDILYRKHFFDSLLNDYYDRNRTIVISTHQVEDVQHVLTDLMFINRGRIVLNCSMEEFDLCYQEVMVHPEHIGAARALKPIHETKMLGRNILLFDHADRQQLAAIGDERTPHPPFQNRYVPFCVTHRTRSKRKA